MTRRQFRVLYGQFLLRIVDLEILSAHGDILQLVGRFTALLAFVSMIFAMGAVLFDPARLTPDTLLQARWGMEHRLIATTMLVTGLFTVLSWDAIYLDRRDVLVLAPLPVRTSTIFFAKLAACGSGLGIAVLAINSFTGLSWPFVLIPADAGMVGWFRSLLAYWVTMALAGACLFMAVLSLQGLMAQALPHRVFLRVSSWLQLAAFCLFISVYLLQPTYATPAAVLKAESDRVLLWLPSYWFLGLFQILNGSSHPVLEPSARRALLGLGVLASTTVIAFLLSYVRTLRKIVEEPDIAPGLRMIPWSPRFENSLRTAILLFIVRTLFRSRQHRVLLAFYMGVALAIVIGYMRTPLALRESAPGAMVSVPAMVSTIVVLCAAVVGMRVVFALPVALQANWLFRVTQSRPPKEYLAAVRLSLLCIAAAPACIVSAFAMLYIWAWEAVAGHVLALVALSFILVDLTLYSCQKLPFTCSYLPGKTNLQIAAFFSLHGLIAVTHGVARFERQALEDPRLYAVMACFLAAVVAVARLRTWSRARSPETELEFTEEPTTAVYALDLHKDGVPPRQVLE